MKKERFIQVSSIQTMPVHLNSKLTTNNNNTQTLRIRKQTRKRRTGTEKRIRKCYTTHIHKWYLVLVFGVRECGGVDSQFSTQSQVTEALRQVLIRHSYILEIRFQLNLGNLILEIKSTA